MQSFNKVDVIDFTSQVNEGAQLSVDVLNQLSNNPALQRQINPLQKVAELAADGKTGIDQDQLNHHHKSGKRKFDFRNVSAVCSILWSSSSSPHTAASEFRYPKMQAHNDDTIQKYDISSF